MSEIRHDECACEAEFGHELVHFRREHFALCHACKVWWSVGSGLFTTPYELMVRKEITEKEFEEYHQHAIETLAIYSELEVYGLRPNQ
jgi:hypothetical protein